MKPSTEKTKSLASNAEWKAWGELDPRYGVATKKDRAKNGANPWGDEAFFELGATDWNLFRPKWEQYGLIPGNCVEIGCGAGRMTAHLARYFEHVQGVDVSPGMIEYARQHVPANVTFHVTGGLEIPLPDDSADAVFSTHVLQHLAGTAAAAVYFAQMHRVLRCDGSIMVHVPIIVWPSGMLRGVHRQTHSVKTFLDRCTVQLRRYGFALGLLRTPPMQVIWYEINWLYRTLEKAGFHDIELRILFGGSDMALQHPFLFARKS